MTKNKSKVLLLDRDGVINHDSDDYIRSVDQLKLIDGVLEAFVKLSQLDYTVLVITNQSAIARGYLTESGLAEIHQKINEWLLQANGATVSRFYHCPHHPDEGCQCRKPKPGMILQAQSEWSFDPQNTWFVGDKLSDVQAATNAGCRPILVKTGKTLPKKSLIEAVSVYDDLLSFVNTELVTTTEL